MARPSVMFVHAHPDDESLWTGGTIARLVDRQVDVHVVTCTWAPNTPRHRELQSALATLGVTSCHCLGYADRGVPESAPGAQQLGAADFDSAVRSIVADLREHRPSVLVTYDAYGIYGHPDHIHTHRLVLAAIDAAACGSLYPEIGEAWQVSSLYLITMATELLHGIRTAVGVADADRQPAPGTPADQISLTLDVTNVMDRKWRAINAHQSEMQRSHALRQLTTVDQRQRNAVLASEAYVRRDYTNPGTDLESLLRD